MPAAEEEKSEVEACVLKWVGYPILVAVAAIVAVGLLATLVSPQWEYPSWLNAAAGIPAVGGYYGWPFRTSISGPFSWTRTTDASKHATAPGRVAASMKGKQSALHVNAPEAGWQREAHRKDLVAHRSSKADHTQTVDLTPEGRQSAEPHPG